jgi:hypothetical protein
MLEKITNDIKTLKKLLTDFFILKYNLSDRNISLFSDNCEHVTL